MDVMFKYVMMVSGKSNKRKKKKSKCRVWVRINVLILYSSGVFITDKEYPYLRTYIYRMAVIGRDMFLGVRLYLRANC